MLHKLLGPTYFLTYSLIYLPTYLLTYLLTDLLTYLQVMSLTSKPSVSWMRLGLTRTSSANWMMQKVARSANRAPGFTLFYLTTTGTAISFFVISELLSHNLIIVCCIGVLWSNQLLLSKADHYSSLRFYEVLEIVVSNLRVCYCMFVRVVNQLTVDYCTLD